MFINVDHNSEAQLINEHETFGKLLRTKGAESDEGGVVAGFSVVDQPFITKEIGALSHDTHIKPLINE